MDATMVLLLLQSDVIKYGESSIAPQTRQEMVTGTVRLLISALLIL